MAGDIPVCVSHLHQQGITGQSVSQQSPNTNGSGHTFTSNSRPV